MPPQCRVLLAEDNPVNQDVGRAMLETFGCQVDVAENGLEAIRLFESNRYELVFMDCQMPKMDGWEATARIREAEKGSSKRTPVVALTAYILDEERDKCRCSGMDDYLGKPFGLRELSEVLHRWVQLNKDGDVPGMDPAVPPPTFESDQDDCTRLSPACLDSKALDNLKSALGSSASKMLEMVINLYLTNSPSLLSELRMGLQRMDPEAIGRAAHTLKSSSANLGAKVLADYCRGVEEISRLGHSREIEELILRIECEYKRVEASLQVIMGRES